eukprot:IDg113t1
MHQNQRTVGAVSCARFGVLVDKSALENHAMSMFVDDGTDGNIPPAIRALKYSGAQSVIERFFGAQEAQRGVPPFDPAYRSVRNGTDHEDLTANYGKTFEPPQSHCPFGAVSCARFAAVADTTALEKTAMALFIDDGTDGSITAAIRAVRFSFHAMWSGAFSERTRRKMTKEACTELHGKDSSTRNVSSGHSHSVVAQTLDGALSGQPDSAPDAFAAAIKTLLARHQIILYDIKGDQSKPICCSGAPEQLALVRSACMSLTFSYAQTAYRDGEHHAVPRHAQFARGTSESLRTADRFGSAWK